MRSYLAGGMAALLGLLVTACNVQTVSEEDGADAAIELAATEENAEISEARAGLSYPETAERGVSETLHGQEITDPFRWLEDDVRVNPDVARWVEAQNQTTFSYLDQLPGRDAIKARMTELWNFEKFGLPTQKGDLYFFSRNDGLQNQSVYYVQEGLEGAPRMLLDPNSWSEDGATALAGAWPSPDGARVAYAIQDGGSDWRTIRVIDTATGEETGDQVEWVKFSSITWDAAGEGFFYARYPEPEEGAEFQNLNFNHEIFYHRLGTDQSQDVSVYARPDNPDHGFAAELSDDGRYLVVTVWKGTDDRYELLLIDLENDNTLIPLVEGFTHDYAFVGNDGETFFFRTNVDAPRNRLIAMDVNNPDPENWTEIVPQSEATLSDASFISDTFVTEYMEDATSVVRLYARDGTPQGVVELPGLGVASGFAAAKDTSQTFYSFSSLITPPSIYRYDVGSGESTVFKAPAVPFEPDDYALEQIFYASKDGTSIPMFIAYRKGIEPNGANPTLLYGYGGFNISILPSFSITRLAWMDMGGVYAVANLRGGGEYGKAWHDAGRLDNKQNVFDDFAAAAVYLHDAGWASPETTAIYGRSNGGLLVGATVNQRPELFAAGLPAVGVMDMLRFHKFTAGRFWVDDYGNPDDAEDFEVLKAYSPYHNIQEGVEYPAILTTTADTDDRVVPGHSFKYTAALQMADTGDAPKLIRIETRAGHGSGKPTEKIIEEYADKWAFIAHHTGLQLPDGYGE